MRNIKITIQYDGTLYAGWQLQKNQPTIQGEIECGLNSIFQTPIRITGAGRTDAGVHALKQVANFKIDHYIKPNNLLSALNSILPKDIRIIGCEDVELAFSSRYSAKWRKYVYVIYNDKICPPFFNKYVYQVNRKIDIELLNKTLQFLIGTYDFTSFSTKKQEDNSMIREVIKIEVINNYPFIFITIKANAFLRKMVRMIIGAVLKANLEKMEPDILYKTLLLKDRTAHLFPTIPPHGLYLSEVFYEGSSTLEQHEITNYFTFLKN